MQYKEKLKNAKETYTDGSKHGKEGSFAAVFTDITRRRALPKEASISTAEIITIKVDPQKMGDI